MTDLKALNEALDSALQTNKAMGKKLQQQAEAIKVMREGLERIKPERYPSQVFLPMTDKQWHSLKLWCESEGFPIDRLSGNYGRELRAADMAIAREALAASAREAGYGQ